MEEMKLRTPVRVSWAVMPYTIHGVTTQRTSTWTSPPWKLQKSQREVS